MLKRAKMPLQVRAICRGEGVGYLAVSARVELRGLRVVAHTSDGCRVPCELCAVEVSSERGLLAAVDEFAWIVVLTLIDRAVKITFLHGDEYLAEHMFSPLASKVASRLLTRRSPEVAALLRGFEQRRGAGKSLLFIREGLPADNGMVSWRVQAEFPTREATLVPWLRAFDQSGNALDANVMCMEDHTVPFSRDNGLTVRLLWFSCLLPEHVGSFYVEAGLGDDDSLRAFACMNEPRARGMLADTSHRMDGAPANDGYEEWFANTRVTGAELARQRVAASELSDEQRPLISVVVPAHHMEQQHLSESVASVLRQSYDRWELVTVTTEEDFSSANSLLTSFADERVRVITAQCDSISELASQGIEASRGDYVAFLDGGDVLESDALWRYVETIAKNPSVDLLYCDEDRLHDGRVCEPIFKAFPNYGKLYTCNYVGHLLMLSRQVLDDVEWSEDDVADAWEYDLTLKAFEVARHIEHVPRMLYHVCNQARRMLDDGEAGRRALSAHFDRRGIAADVEAGPLPCTYRVRYVLPNPAPLVSIVIPTRDHASLLRTCVESILAKSTYSNYEIVLVENSSEKDETFALYDELVAQDTRVKVETWEAAQGQGFNYSALVNYGVAHSTGEFVLLLNNDTEVIEPTWIEEMVGCLMRPEVGVVGAKLLFYDGLIQHVGMVANPAGDNCHVCQNLTKTALGAGYAAAMPGDYSMVTGACQLTPRKLFDELGGYDEGLAVGYNDSDYCLRVRERGWSVAMAPYALLYHREFSSRGREIADVRLRTRLMQEKARIMQRHPNFYAQGDPALNPNLNGFSAYFDL